MKRKKAVQKYREIVKTLHDLQVKACPFISRQDNNQLFEIAFFVEAVANRMEQKYPETDYPRLLK